MTTMAIGQNVMKSIWYAGPVKVSSKFCTL